MDSSRVWKKVVRAGGCKSKKQAVAVKRWMNRQPDGSIPTLENGWPKGRPLRVVSEELARMGHTNGGGAPYHPHQLKEIIADGLARSAIMVFDRARLDEDCVKRVREEVLKALRRKRPYSRSTPQDPYLHGRLELWKLRRPGRKPRPE